MGIKLDKTHVESLLLAHNTTLAAVDDAITYTERCLRQLGQYYEGASTAFIEELSEPLKQHLQLLKGCYASSKAFVEQAQELLDRADKSSSHATSTRI